jgi:DNA-directed RNA polymerase III subunit RPC4
MLAELLEQAVPLELELPFMVVVSVKIVSERTTSNKYIGSSGGRRNFGGRSSPPNAIRTSSTSNLNSGKGDGKSSNKVKTERGNSQFEDSADDTEGEEGVTKRMNIEFISLLESEDDQDAELPDAGSFSRPRVKSEKPHGLNLKPIRLDRREHVERTVDVNTEASIGTSAELRRKAKERGSKPGTGAQLFVSDEGDAVDDEPAAEAEAPANDDDVEITSERVRGRPKRHDRRVKVKEEPSEAMDLDPSLPAAEKERTSKALGKQPESEAAEKKKSKGKKRRPDYMSQPVIQTEEEQDEWDRRQEDVRELVAELGKVSTTKRDIALDVDVSTDARVDKRRSNIV